MKLTLKRMNREHFSPIQGSDTLGQGSTGRGKPDDFRE